MTDSDQVPPRLRSIRFPAALEWIRVEDVVRFAGGTPGTSKKAFRQRWATRDEFIVDAVVYTLQFADPLAADYAPLTDRLAQLGSSEFGDEVATLADDLLTLAESRPRSYLMLHLGGVLHRHRALQTAFSQTWESQRGPFLSGYSTLLHTLGLTFRPGWTTERFDRALQAMVDGFLLQGRIHRDDPGMDEWTHTCLFAETAVAFTIGVLDAERCGRTAREVLSAMARGSGEEALSTGR